MMKKITLYSFLVLGAASVFAACSKEISQSDSSPESLLSLTIPASKASCKTSLGPDRQSVRWSEGDALTVFDREADCQGHRFDGTVLDDPAWAVFSGEVHLDTKTFYALYPYDAQARMSGTVITTSLPAAQDATVSSFAAGAALSFASATLANHTVGDGLTFEPLCAVIAFEMPAYADRARSVVISSVNGAAMAGTVTIDVAEGAIVSVSGPSSVTLAADALQAGVTYYAAIAPGTYAGGFRFQVTTEGGQVYTAVNPRDMTLAAGTVYALGTAGLTLADEDVSLSVAISHTYDAGVLTGSSAVLSPVGVCDEFATMIASWSVELRRDGSVVRRLSESSGQMAVAGGWTYLPQGEYDIVASYTSVSGAVKQVRGKASSPAPTVGVSLGGYCSYDYYAGGNGCARNVSTANSLDAGTVYAPSVSIGISDALLGDSKYTASWSYSYDGGAATAFEGRSVTLADIPGQNWAKHSLSATCTFDGVTGHAVRDFHITGLPFRDSTPGKTACWSKGSSCSSDGNSIKMGNAAAGNLTVTASFYCPADINVSLASNVKIKTASLLNRNGVTVKIGGTKVIDQTGPKGTAVTETYDLSASGTLTASNATLQYEAKSWGANSYVWLNSAAVTYR